MDRSGGSDVLSLMAAAADAAALDAGRSALLADLDAVFVPRGTWQHADPGRELAGRFGATGARSVLAELGVLQSTLVGRACEAVWSGAADVVMVVGGEAAYSAKRAGAENRPLPGAAGDGNPPDEVLRPSGDIVSALEIRRQFWTPAHQYALIERALGRTPDELDAAWSAFATVAAANPDAWWPEAVEPAALEWGSATNPPVAHPYGRRHCSQMNVDQAGALLVVSAERARALGLPEDRWIFPALVGESNVMVPVPNRVDPARSPGFAELGRAVQRITGLEPAAAGAVDLYSCFPAAVEVQRRELGLSTDRTLTVTGGMSFAGGPFNNYVLQSTAKMAEVLRSGRAEHGMVTAISGMITKQGLIWLGTAPAAGGFAYVDVSADVEAITERARVCEAPDEVDGLARVVSSTVVAGPEPTAWVLAELPDGSRTLATSVEPEVVARWSRPEPPVGDVHVRGDRFAPA